MEALLAEVHSLATDAAAPGATLMTGIGTLDIMGTHFHTHTCTPSFWICCHCVHN